MYTYFKELEHPNDYSFYLQNTFLSYMYDKRVEPYIGDEFFNKYKSLFKELKFADTIISSFNTNFIDMNKVDDYNLYGDLIDYNEDILYHQERIYDDIRNLFGFYRFHLRCVISFYPKYKDRIENIINLLETAIEEINTKSIIEVSRDKYITYTMPNAFYITPSNFLYNSNGMKGHKGGNLLNDYYAIKSDLLENKRIMSGHNKMIDNVETRQFVTSGQFKGYLNLIYKIISIETPKTQAAEKLRKEIFDKEDNHSIDFGYYYELFNKYNGKEGKLESERTYQRKIVKLYLGFLHAQEDFINYLSILNLSNRRSELFKKIIDLTNEDISDILVRFCNFNKIETSLDKNITTSNLNINDFKEYLDKGWIIQIVPKIYYDRYLDDIKVQDLNSYFIDRYLDNIDKKYYEKILINRHK